MRLCPECHQPVFVKDAFCLNCGHRLRSPRRWWGRLGGAALLFVAGLGAVKGGVHGFGIAPPLIKHVAGSSVAAVSLSVPDCRFVLGFRTLHDLLPAQVGQCLEDEHYDAAGRDVIQHTTGGLLVWQKRDNVSSFTDGYQTWLLGPHGLQERLNTQRLPWEQGAGARQASSG